MINHFFIYLFIVFILFIILFNGLPVYNYYKKSFEKFYPENNIPQFVKNYEEINNLAPPDYSVENITEYNFNRLFEKVAMINKNKINLENKTNYNFYTQSTTDDKLRMDLDDISKFVLKTINNDGYYDFAKTNFGDVKVWVDKNGNEEITYELFLWDKRNYFEIKLLVNVVKFVEEQEATQFGIRESPYLTPYFNIGYPFADQIIPLPTDIITTEHAASSLSSIKPNIPAKIKLLYINEIQIQNSTLIVDYQKNKYPFKKLDVDENGFSGITDMSLEYIKIRGDKNPYLEKGTQYNQWPTLDEQPKFMGQFPSKAPPQLWDVDSIYYYGKPEKEEIKYTPTEFQTPFEDKRLCDVYEPGTRWSSDKEELQGQFWPSNYAIPRNCGENEWLFDLSRNNPGNNTNVGGGKR